LHFLFGGHRFARFRKVGWAERSIDPRSILTKAAANQDG
jgi:hypothetical protein